MLGYLLRRLAMTIPTLLLVSAAVFTLVRLIPGDPVQLMLGDSADQAQVTAMRRELGLEDPLPVQFALWLGKAGAFVGGDAVVPPIVFPLAIPIMLAIWLLAVSPVVVPIPGTSKVYGTGGQLYKFDLQVENGVTGVDLNQFASVVMSSP